MGVHVDTSEVRKLEVDLANSSGRVGGPAAYALRTTAREIEADAKAFAPKVTGSLAASISTDVVGDGRFGEMSAEIGPSVPYAPEVEYGAEPHLIRAHGGGFLEFSGPGGSSVFAEEVHHPGNAPEPFMGPAFDRHAPLLEERLAEIGERFL